MGLGVSARGCAPISFDIERMLDFAPQKSTETQLKF
jgi:hypothetical protein